jgi:putative zinc finger/helix-turn-helix YgiT family protein
MDANSYSCPECGHTEFSIADFEDKFQYGEGIRAVELLATIPVHTCESCEYQFSDCDAEEARHEAVCRHLGRMPPSKIRDLRKAHNLSREEFASITGIGTASLARWESGQLIQGAAHDNFLYLLLNKESLIQLRARDPEQAYEVLAQEQSPAIESAFIYITVPNQKML